ncbi:MAG TPA: flotillin domain-containing protein [Polyangiaceae bacterium]|nr:flotillin domain-containing protein [Polyangiaceae bacterium]
MFGAENTSSVIFIVGAVAVGLLFLVSFMSIVSRCYRRCGADEALVRTGSGGNKVVIGGGVLVFPVIHQLLRVSLRSVKLLVERSGKNALVTGDKIKANVTTELYIKVEPLAEDVLAAARSFGDRNLDEHAIGALIEGKLTDALRSVAAVQTFMSLHGKRKEFAEHIQAALAEELKKNGLTLENVSITSFAMVPVKELDEHDVFDAEGLRAITESVQSNREKTNQIQREKDNAIQAQNVEARMRQLQLEQQQQQAEADQMRRVSEYAAQQTAETAKAVFVQEQSRDLASYEKAKAVETARIAQEQAVAVALAGKQRAEREAQIAAQKGQQTAEIEKDKVVQAAEIDRQKALEAATIEKEKVVGAALIAKEQAIEVARIGKQIAVTQSEEQQARAEAAKALAQAEEEKAKQGIATVETTAKAQRDKVVQIIAAEAEGDRQRIAAEARAVAALKEAEAMVTLANAIATKGTAEADARRKMVEAENALGLKFVLRDVALRAVDAMPELARELMAPAKAIREIKVLQTGGFGGGGGSDGVRPALGAMSPILKSVLEAGAAYPLLRELMTFAKLDPGTLGEKAQSALGDLAGEIETILQKEDAGNGVGAAAPVEGAARDAGVAHRDMGSSGG